MSEAVHTRSVVPRRWLVIHPFSFSCPYCGKQWERGGSKEGFVKSGAENHVMGCYEVALFLRGYWLDGYPLVGPVDRHDGNYRRLKALTARRKRSAEWGRIEACYGSAVPEPAPAEEET